MKIRRVTEKDVNEIVELRQNNLDNIAKKKETGMVYETLSAKNNVENILGKIKKYELFCLTDESGILSTVDFRDGEIGGMFVRYDLVGQGFGLKAMTFIEEHAKRKGFDRVWLKAAEKAKGFYVKMGYSVKNKIESDGIINFLMEKEL